MSALRRYLDHLLRLDLREHWHLLLLLLHWMLLAGVVGSLAGTASAWFLIALGWATRTREAQPSLIIGLPLVGLLLGWVYWRYAGDAARGNALIVEELHQHRTAIPLRMTPLIFVATVLTHLVGGSAGREGVAVQMGSSLADWVRRQLRLVGEDRRWMLIAGVSGGFSAMFGTPLAGCVFSLEVQRVGRIRYDGVIPALSAAVVGDLVARAWGATHFVYPALPPLDVALVPVLKTLIAGVAFGLTALLFIELTHGLKHLAHDLIRTPPLRPLLGGVLVIVMTVMLGTTEYLGLSEPLLRRAVMGEALVPLAFLGKLVFTAVTLGFGWWGGEVTPLFVIGATLGAVLGRWLGLDPAWLASVGMVSTLAGATNTPLACILLGVELFGSGSVLYVALGCVMAYLASGHRGIYMTQRVDVPKSHYTAMRPDERLDAIYERRAGWFSQRRKRE
jgi:H+/Cl- antiporter ClcA